MADETPTETSEKLAETTKLQAEIAGSVSGALRPVVERLTNEFLLFIIALMLVTTLMAFLAPTYATTAIPVVAFFGVLGVVAYLWTWRRTDGRAENAIQEATRRVTVTVGQARDNFRAVGEMGMASGGATEVRVRKGSGNAAVYGTLLAEPAERINLTDDENALIRAFRKLDPAAQKVARRQVEDWND
jgi:hypothetical protein